MQHAIRKMQYQVKELHHTLVLVQQMNNEYIDASGEDDPTMETAIKALQELISQVSSNIKLACEYETEE